MAMKRSTPKRPIRTSVTTKAKTLSIRVGKNYPSKMK
jgi:hypothetical protein